MPRQLPEGRDKWAVSRSEYERRLKGDINWQRLTRLVTETHQFDGYGAKRQAEDELRLMVQSVGQALIDACAQRAVDPWVALCHEYGLK